MLEQIQQAIWELQGKNVKKEDMILAFSPFVERLLLNEYHKLFYPRSHLYLSIFSIEKSNINTLWPYNEIVIYTKVTCYYPNLIIKIPIHVQTNQFNNQESPKLGRG